jgi:hypothetical protein
VREEGRKNKEIEREIERERERKRLLILSYPLKAERHPTDIYATTDTILLRGPTSKQWTICY